jgi:hypothetical protein
VHHMAAGAHKTRQMIPGGDLGFDRRAAVAAKIQK